MLSASNGTAVYLGKVKIFDPKKVLKGVPRNPGHKDHFSNHTNLLCNVFEPAFFLIAKYNVVNWWVAPTDHFFVVASQFVK